MNGNKSVPFPPSALFFRNSSGDDAGFGRGLARAWGLCRAGRPCSDCGAFHMPQQGHVPSKQRKDSFRAAPPELVNLEWGRHVKATQGRKAHQLIGKRLQVCLAWPGSEKRLAFLSINKSPVQHQSRSPLSIAAFSSRMFL